MDETQRTAEFDRMWTAASPAVRTLLMANPNKLLSQGKVLLVNGSGEIPVPMLDVYWVLADDEGGQYLSEAFREFVIDKRPSPSAG